MPLGHVTTHPLSDKIQTEHARVHHSMVQAQVIIRNISAKNRPCPRPKNS